ncbi:hypothetical protein GCM10020001_029700 [Nonomuraea salmonea]
MSGTGCGSTPDMADRSEWHTPVARILTRTSVGPTGGQGDVVAEVELAVGAYGVQDRGAHEVPPRAWGG